MKAKEDCKTGNNFREEDENLRLLVAIASYGEKNISYLKQVISSYRCMKLKAEIVVLTEAPKNISEVKQLVGLPAKDPWSLPFGHRKLFAENADRFDLFVYCEDDVLVTEESIRAFVRLTPLMREDEIAGFMRYEVGMAGTMYLPDVHGGYHWKPDSVKQRGEHLVAEFTNEHSAFYLVTRKQLKRAIASGGFLCEPHEGRYDMLCTAATDVYANCGFHRVLCITEIDRFFIHHLSNKYAGKIGLPVCLFREQIETLKKIHNGEHPASTLCSNNPIGMHQKWFKDYYEKPSDHVLNHVPKNARTVLSIGCGHGETEVKLKQRGCDVTALPLDSVIGAKPARMGVEVVFGTLEQCMEQLLHRRFDCVIISNLLHLQSNPACLLNPASHLVTEGGTLLVRSPNFDRIGTLIKRKIGWKEFRRLRSFEQSGISICKPLEIKRNLYKLGFRTTELLWFNHAPIRWKKMEFHGRLGWITADDWFLKASKPPCNGSNQKGRLNELSIHFQ